MFTNKQLGIILIIVGLVIAGASLFQKTKEDFYIDALIEEHDGVCVLDNGYCLHNDRNWTGYILSWVASGILIVLGTYLTFIDKSYKLFKEEREHFTQELKEAKSKDEFSAYLAGFTPEEQSILKAVNDQEGIKQSTLRYRVGMSKATLSLMLNSLVKRDIISKKKSGKTNEIFLRKKF